LYRSSLDRRRDLACVDPGGAAQPRPVRLLSCSCRRAKSKEVCAENVLLKHAGRNTLAGNFLIRFRSWVIPRQSLALRVMPGAPDKTAAYRPPPFVRAQLTKEPTAFLVTRSDTRNGTRFMH
jgi:hypothetical protein